MSPMGDGCHEEQISCDLRDVGNLDDRGRRLGGNYRHADKRRVWNAARERYGFGKLESVVLCEHNPDGWGMGARRYVLPR